MAIRPMQYWLGYPFQCVGRTALRDGVGRTAVRPYWGTKLVTFSVQKIGGDRYTISIAASRIGYVRSHPASSGHPLHSYDFGEVAQFASFR